MSASLRFFVVHVGVCVCVVVLDCGAVQERIVDCRASLVGFPGLFWQSRRGFWTVEPQKGIIQFLFGATIVKVADSLIAGSD